MNNPTFVYNGQHVPILDSSSDIPAVGELFAIIEDTTPNGKYVTIHVKRMCGMMENDIVVTETVMIDVIETRKIHWNNESTSYDDVL